MSNISDFFPTPSGGGSNNTDVLASDVFADIVIVGGGGGSTIANDACPQTLSRRDYSGAGGGGLYRLYYGLNCDETYPITVGAGGAAGPTNTADIGASQGENGSPSKFNGSQFIAYGGGGGGSYCGCTFPSTCPTSTGSFQTYGRAGGQGGASQTVAVNGGACSFNAASHSSFGSRYGYHYGNSDYLHRAQVCPTSCGPFPAICPVNGYDLNSHSACDTIARAAYLCTDCTCNAPYCECSYSAGAANTGDGAGSCNGAAAGGSGFVIVSYPNSHRAAPARPGSVDCSPFTPGYYTYLFTSSGSITL
jgi:hypothetical protein